jgi:hypothetical protein
MNTKREKQNCAQKQIATICFCLAAKANDRQKRQATSGNKKCHLLYGMFDWLIGCNFF